MIFQNELSACKIRVMYFKILAVLGDQKIEMYGLSTYGENLGSIHCIALNIIFKVQRHLIFRMLAVLEINLGKLTFVIHYSH